MYFVRENLGATMDWCAEVEKLLKSSLELGEELSNNRNLLKAQIIRDSSRLDQKLEACGDELRELQEESDGLFARSMGFSEDVLSLENEQNSGFEQLDEEIEKKDRVVTQMAGSIARLRDVLAIKNGLGDGRQLLLPPTTFTLDRFRQRKDNGECWYSPYFYTHKQGYKMQLRVLPNGLVDGLGTHISLFVNIVPGEFDDLLTWPFCGIVALHLVNQRKNSPNLVKKVSFTGVDSLDFRERPRVDVVEKDRKGWGTYKLIAHMDLEEGASCYLKEDCLSFCVWNIDVFCQHH